MATSFHFCGESPVGALASDLQRTNKLNSQQYEELLDVLFSFLTNSISEEKLEDELSEYATSHGINIGPLNNMAKSLIIIGNAMARKNLSIPQIESDLQNLKISESHMNTFCEKWKNNISQMYSSLLTTSNRGKRLVDVDWKFGVSASSSENQQVGNCFVQMKLSLRSESGKIENRVIEMTLPQFYNFTHEIEKAKISLETMA